jgi:hypothetical protein
MLGNTYFKQMFEGFEKQFPEEGGEIAFRQDGKGAPVRVSAAERDAFISGFRRATWISFGVVMLATLLLAGGVVWLALQSDAEFTPLPLYIGFGVTFVGLLAAVWWAWRAPVRALRYRASSGQALTREEVERKFFENLSYGKIAGITGAVALALFSLSRKEDLLHGWSRLWLVFFGAILILIAVQTIRKWRYEARKRA